MNTCSPTHCLRNREVQTKKRRREPHAAAESLPEPLVFEPRAMIINGRGVEEGAYAELGDVQRRRDRRAHLDGTGNERIAYRRAGLEPSKVVHAAEHRLQKRRQHLVGGASIDAADDDALTEEARISP